MKKFPLYLRSLVESIWTMYRDRVQIYSRLICFRKSGSRLFCLVVSKLWTKTNVTLPTLLLKWRKVFETRCLGCDMRNSNGFVLSSAEIHWVDTSNIIFAVLIPCSQVQKIGRKLNFSPPFKVNSMPCPCTHVTSWGRWNRMSFSRHSGHMWHPNYTCQDLHRVTL